MLASGARLIAGSGKRPGGRQAALPMTPVVGELGAAE
jgi:hypothetical protein